MQSISFYPPIELNYRLGSSDGISIDFLYLNITGYITYVWSMTLQVYNSTAREQFHQKYGNYPLLTFLDILYAAHGLVLTLVTLSQVHDSLKIWNIKRRISTRLHRGAKVVLVLLFAYVSTSLVRIWLNDLILLDLAMGLAMCKVAISFLKYIPQLYHNYQRKSMVGYSIVQIWLDSAGGVFSLLQLFLDSYMESGQLEWADLIHNRGKLGLGLVTLSFDACFLVQYYIVYRHEGYEEGDQDGIQTKTTPLMV